MKTIITNLLPDSDTYNFQWEVYLSEYNGKFEVDCYAESIEFQVDRWLTTNNKQKALNRYRELVENVENFLHNTNYSKVIK